MFIAWPRQRSKSAASATTPWEGLGPGDAAFVNLTLCFAPRPLTAVMYIAVSKDCAYTYQWRETNGPGSYTVKGEGLLKHWSSFRVFKSSPS
jgi:hypothetical protein